VTEMMLMFRFADSFNQSFDSWDLKIPIQLIK